MTYQLLDLFSGIGGFSLGLERTGGFETVAFCDIDPFAQSVLKRQWPDVKLYNDVQNLTAASLVADGLRPNAICGGFPCQDISVAGHQQGLEAERSGLWSHFARVVSELRPEVVFVENVANLLAGPTGNKGQWFGRILGDLAEIGYDATWANIPVSRFREEHTRHRIWIVAYPSKIRRPDYRQVFNRLANETPVKGGKTKAALGHTCSQWLYAHGDLRDLRKDDGISGAVDRIWALGNAVDPKIPELLGRAWLDYITHPQIGNALDDGSPSL